MNVCYFAMEGIEQLVHTSVKQHFHVLAGDRRREAKQIRSKPTIVSALRVLGIRESMDGSKMALGPDTLCQANVPGELFFCVCMQPSSDDSLLTNKKKKGRWFFACIQLAAAGSRKGKVIKD